MPAGARGTRSPWTSGPTRREPGTCARSPRRTPRGRAVAERLLEDEPPHADADEKAFAARFRLVHEWRKFLFEDPGLPAELLPRDWPGVPASPRCSPSEAARLKPAADRFVGRCLGTA